MTNTIPSIIVYNKKGSKSIKFCKIILEEYLDFRVI